MGLASLVNKQVKQKGPEEVVVDAIMNSIKVMNPPSQHSSANIKPSKIQCERQMYYILTGARANELTTTDPKLTLIQKVGTHCHLLLQEAMSQANPGMIIYRDPKDLVKEAEAKGLHTHIVPTSHSQDNKYECHCYNDDYGFSFMWDGALYIKDLSAIVEIKSEDHFKNIKRISADEGHIEQATCYSLALGIDTVIFLYLNRNYLNIKPYLVKITPEMKQVVIDKIDRVQAAKRAGELPTKCTCKACKYCDYTGICRGDFNPLDSSDLTYDPLEKV